MHKQEKLRDWRDDEIERLRHAIRLRGRLLTDGTAAPKGSRAEVVGRQLLEALNTPDKEDRWVHDDIMRDAILEEVAEKLESVAIKMAQYQGDPAIKATMQARSFSWHNAAQLVREMKVN